MPRPSLPLLSFIALALVAGCAGKTRASLERTAADILISDEQESQIGLQVRGELEKGGVKYLGDKVVNDYVVAIAGPVLKAADADRRNIRWSVAVIDDPKTVNAFATPGGYVYVYTGLLLTAETEGEVVGVLSHEAGHVTGRHSARQLVDAYGLEAVAKLALGENPGLASQLGAAVVGKGLMLANSRADETEADEYGARYSSASGYDPHGLATFFQKLMRDEGKTPRILTWLSTHPATPDRIAHVNQYIAANRLGGAKTQGPDFASVKARLQSMPASPSAAAPGPAAASPAPAAEKPAPAPAPASGGRRR